MPDFPRKPQANRPKKPGKEVQPAFRVAGLNHNWEGVIDKMLGEAVQQKEWQDLKGKGQRMNLDAPAGVPADQVMSNKIMRDNEVAPAWIEDRKALLHRIGQWRQKLRSQVQSLGASALQSQEQQTRLRQEIGELNRAIQDLNIAIPVFRLELVKLDLAEEMQRAQEC